jgi:hypothetical protein
MRDFLDAILEFIDSESLTDNEFNSIDLDDEEYTFEVYQALRTIIDDRETVTDQAAKLIAYFTARGVDVSGETAETPKSNIFIGVKLCN